MLRDSLVQKQSNGCWRVGTDALARAMAHRAELKFVANRNSFPANLLDDGVYAPPDLIVSNKLLEIADVCQFAHAYRSQSNRAANTQALLYSG